MTVYAVFVYCTIQGCGSRWIDTQWAQESKAIERGCELERVMAAFGVPAHSIKVVKLSVVDTAIVKEKA
jgi:hypothetical protein